MLVPTKTMMRPAWAMGRREMSAFTSHYLGLVASDRTIRSSRRNQLCPSYHGDQTSVRLFTSRINTEFDKVVPKSDVDEDDIELVDDDEFVEQMAFSDDEENDSLAGLPRGSTDGFYVVKTYNTSENEFDLDQVRSIVNDADFQRLHLTPHNISVPVALMLLDPVEYPSRSRARKVCRKANIMIHRGPLAVDENTGKELWDSSKCLRARVGDRVFPGGTDPISLAVWPMFRQN
jgi:hypothetical protein